MQSIDPTSRILHQLFAKVWATGKVPSAWKEGITNSLYKGKDPRNECVSNRPISFPSDPGKVFAHVLPNRIDPLLRSKRRFEQSGYTPGRSTVDALLALRLLSEVHHEFSQPPHVAFVDLKVASDSVDRLVLLKALQGIGIPQYLLYLIEDVHNGFTSSVRTATMQSPSFITTSGVRQGCVLAPALFCRAIDWIMERVASTVGFSLGNDHLTDLDYADDVVLLAHAVDDLHTALDIFETTASKLGSKCVLAEDKNPLDFKLHALESPTSLGAGDSNASNLSVSGQSVEEVSEFTYLGSVLSTTGRCQPDVFRRICIASSAVYSMNRV